MPAKSFLTGVALSGMMTLGTALCFVIAIGARAVLMEPSVSKMCLALAALLGAWLAITRKR